MIVTLQLQFADQLRSFRMDLDLDRAQDRGMQHFISRNTLPEPEVIHAMCRIIKPGDTVVDGGAAIGFFTLLMSQLVGPEGKVMAIEPDPSNLKSLEANIDLNGFKNIDVVPAALAGAKGRTVLNLFEDSGYNTITNLQVKNNPSLGQIEVDAFTLDSFGPVDFIKLDIEGAETEVLDAWENYLPCENLICEYNASTVDFSNQKLIPILKDRFYRPFLLHKEGQLPALLFDDVKLIPTTTNCNLLFSTVSEVVKNWPETSYS